MAQFSDLVTSVYNVTKRKDLVNETQQAIIRAIKKEHAAFEYPDDLMIAGPVSLTASNPDNYRYAVSTTSSGLNLYPTIRKIKYIREVLSTINASLYTFNGYYGELNFEEKAVDNIFDNYNLEALTYYTKVGQTINIVAPRTVSQVAICYYWTPDMSDVTKYGNPTSGFTDWLADEFDYAIWEHAAAEIFRIIGKDSEFKAFEQRVMDNRLDIVKAKIGTI